MTDECEQLREELELWIKANAAAATLIGEQEAEIVRLRAALKVYANPGSWLIDNDGVIVTHVEWNIPGENWQLPWLTAKLALARRE